MMPGPSKLQKLRLAKLKKKNEKSHSKQDLVLDDERIDEMVTLFGYDRAQLEAIKNI